MEPPPRGLRPIGNSTLPQRLGTGNLRGPRGQVALKPGRSPMDWAKLRSSGENLRGVDFPGPLRVSAEELAKHKSKDDAWTVLGGKVYNITPYMEYHPGGEKELLRCAGRDGTKLFQLTHAWVNYDVMLDKCLVGFYVPN